MQEMWVQSLGGEDHLEKEMANHYNILACEISWTEEPVGYSPQGHKKSRTWLSNWTTNGLDGSGDCSNGDFPL